MYTLKSIAQRGTLFGAVAALVVATVIPAASVFADELNPLTERSLLLTSSAPGFQDTDGSGNSAAFPNAIGQNYAPAGSGPNGKKTGETFSFKVSTDSVATDRPIMGFTLQYCTSAAGKCQAPGNNTGDAKGAGTRNPDTATSSDLNVNYTAPVAGTDFIVMQGASDVSTGWTMEAVNLEDETHSGALTGANNYVTLKHATGISPLSNEAIKVIFKATETNFITNPGSGSFFVKINTYDSNTTFAPANVIDGGVTVANVMTDSIHITTKVLETMSFSVGTRNRDTVKIASVGEPGYEGDTAVHGTCSPIQQVNNNQLQLGDQDAEFSLSTSQAYDVYSYWRLSSNSSGGASVYYSGDTLANTVGDTIAEVGATAAASTPGTEQFGLAFVDATADDLTPVDKFDPAFTALTVSDPTRYKMPTLFVLDPIAAYADGTGTITAGGDASFAFLASSLTTPALIAQDNSDVISCDTAKMRYMANIGADTPAGVYTTKINYLAAPQY